MAKRISRPCRSQRRRLARFGTVCGRQSRARGFGSACRSIPALGCHMALTAIAPGAGLLQNTEPAPPYAVSTPVGATPSSRYPPQTPLHRPGGGAPTKAKAFDKGRLPQGQKGMAHPWGRSGPWSEQMSCQLRKARAAFTLCDVAGRVRELVGETLDIGHAHAVGKVFKHHLVVGRVAHIHPAL